MPKWLTSTPTSKLSKTRSRGAFNKPETKPAEESQQHVTIPDTIKQIDLIRKLRAVLIRWLGLGCLPKEDRAFTEYAVKELSLPTDL